MNVGQLKHKIQTIFGNEIRFNKEFDEYALKIKNLEENLVEWLTLLKEGKYQPLRPPKNPSNRIFIRKFGSSNRCIVIKIVNDSFKEIHLANHKYYDVMRKKLGLKKDNKYY